MHGQIDLFRGNGRHLESGHIREGEVGIIDRRDHDHELLQRNEFFEKFEEFQSFNSGGHTGAHIQPGGKAPLAAHSFHLESQAAEIFYLSA